MSAERGFRNSAFTATSYSGSVVAVGKPCRGKACQLVLVVRDSGPASVIIIWLCWNRQGVRSVLKMVCKQSGKTMCSTLSVAWASTPNAALARKPSDSHSPAGFTGSTPVSGVFRLSSEAAGHRLELLNLISDRSGRSMLLYGHNRQSDSNGHCSSPTRR